jgi:hypothetical protein
MIVSLAIAAPLAYLVNIRFDEAYTLNTTANGAIEAFKQAIGFGQQAPLYFVLISIWRELDHSIFFARLFSVLCLPLFVWIAFEVSKRYLKNVNPLFVAAIAVVHQQAVWNALDIRLYAMMMVLSGLLLLLFYDGYLSDAPTKRSRILYVLIAILSLYTQYYLGFQMVAGAAVLLSLGRWRMLGRYVLDMALAGLIFLPMLIVLAGQLGNVSGQIEVPLSSGDMVREIYQRVVSLALPVEWIASDGLRRWGVRILLVFILAAFAAKLLRERKAEDVALAVYTIVLVAFFLFALKTAGWALTQTRHLSPLILPLILISFAALSVFKSRAAIWAWFAFVMVLSIVSLAFTWSPLAKPGDFDRVAQHIMRLEKPNEPVLIFHADAIWPLRAYYKGPNYLVALPQENGLEKWDPRNNVITSEQQLIDRLETATGNAERLWLVHDGWCAQGALQFNCELLEKVIADRFVIEDTTSFYTPATVRLLRRR